MRGGKIAGSRLDDPEIGEAREFLAGGRSRADREGAGGYAIDLAFADDTEIGPALEDREFIAGAGLARLGDRAPA